MITGREQLIKGYDLSTLDISKLTLDMIPNFTPEMEARRKELFNKLDGKQVETSPERVEYATLEFTKWADSFRDQVMLDWVISEDEKDEVTRALQLLARVYKLKAGIDSY